MKISVGGKPLMNEYIIRISRDINKIRIEPADDYTQLPLGHSANSAEVHVKENVCYVLLKQSRAVMYAHVQAQSYAQAEHLVRGWVYKGIQDRAHDLAETVFKQ
jgi:hypothetical protein